MSSRRLMNRSLSSDGRSYYSGSDISSQNRRAGCRSYLSSVRSESRSTLCSVMAQLTEETQPTFETTLKSKAVSEDANVKFSCVVSGHPVPEVTWYKDDIQLDRYCGLPKYEISRDEKTHTLQIYNCTLEDAAIYQASAQNSRGIVSCSGVLEVGTMSEYKIHQNYFAKLKLRNENRRREQEESCNTGKENVPGVFEHVRMNSPERAQRKRRSPMETSRRAGSPSEEKAVEEDALSQTPPLEDRLGAPDQVSAEVPVHGISNPEMIMNREKDREGLTYIHDTVHNASSKQTNDHVKKKIKISAATERSKENRVTGRREEMVKECGTSIEKMEVENTVTQITSVTESRDKTAIIDAKKNVKMSVKANKSDSEVSKRAQVAQITSMSESKNKMDITDTKTNEKWSVKVNKGDSKEIKRAQVAEITSITESRSKMDVNDSQKSEKQSVKANKSSSEGIKIAQDVQITSVIESKKKMDTTDTKINEKQSVKVNKSVSEESESAAHISSMTETRNRMVMADTRKSEKQLMNLNKSTSEESKRTEGARMGLVTESRNTKVIKDTKTDIKQSVKANKSASEESKTTKDVQTATVAESRNKMDTKKSEQSMNTSKSISEESKRAQDTQIKLKTKVDVTETKKSEKQYVNANKSVSEESKRAQGAHIASVTESKIKVGITDTKTSEKQPEKAKESVSESKKFQKYTLTQKGAALKVSMTTQTNKIAEKTKLTEQSDRGTANPQLQALDTTQKGNPRSTENKPMDLDDHRNGNPVGTCVKILPHFCGGNDVNVDTGERNASTRSLRGSAAANTHTEPTVPPTHEDIPPVAMELKKKPTLMREVTASVTETLYSCHLASKEQELRAGDQSVASTNSRTLVTGPQNTQLSDKISSGHDSHKLQDGQVTMAMSFSLGDDTLTHMCEKDSKAENQLIEEPDKPKSETKSMSLNNMEENGKKNTTTDVCAQSSTSKEKSTANLNHSTNQIIDTECVQTCISNSVVVPPEDTNGSSVSNVQMKDSKTQKIVSPDFVAKKDIQEQSNVTTSEVPELTFHKTQSCSAEKGGTDPSTFLSQHSKASPTEFTIPAIYITDMDSTSQNNTETERTVDIVEIRTEANAVTSYMTSSNSVNQISNNSHCTDTMKQTTAILESKGLHEVTMQQTNESDLTETSELKTDSDTFIKQLKKAALDLDTSNQCSTMSNAALHINSKGNGKYAEKVNSAVIQPEACRVAVPLKTTVDQSFNSTAAHSEPATRTDQTTTFPRNKTEKSETAMAVCLEESNRDSYQGDKLSLKKRPASPLQSVNNSPLMMSLETNSPRLMRRSVPAVLSKPAENEDITPKSTEKNKENQFKVPQVIRKIRPEVFDASGNLKLWCQFFNIVSDSIIRWYKDEVEIAEINRSAGDETQVCLAIIQMIKRDCGGYKCTITNEYGKDSTEYHLSTEFLSNMFLHEEHKEVGEEIEMTPLIFSKGLADAGCWGSKFYGRVTTEEAQVGLGCEHKTRRLKVIYGLDPVFESGSSCFMKVRSPIAYESREETVLAEKNLQITKQDCRIQNMAREYFKIFAAETRVIESFGAALEVIPLYFTYWPASSVAYATVEAELKGVYLRYCGLDRSGSLVLNEKSEVGQKCCSLQHWIHQWTNGNVLFSRLEGVDTILTNIGIAIRSKGYQGFPCEANPKVFDQFQIQHQCNYFCGLLNLKPLKAPEALQTPVRSKGSSSPLLQRRAASSSSSPQTPRKASKSPKISRKGNPQSST